MKTAKQNTQALTGAIVRYTRNKHRDVDGLTIDRQGDLIEVNFPPHTALYIREIAGEGDSVRFVLDEKPHKPHHAHKHPAPKSHLASMENTATHQQFNASSIKPPHPPESGHIVSFTIPNPRYTRGGKEGKHDPITGVIFEGNYLHLHPDEYEGGEDALSKAAVLHVKARKRIADSGFVNADGYTVYHVHSVIIGEK